MKKAPGPQLKYSGIPTKTKCFVCQRVKPINAYSTKQTDELRLRVRQVGQAAAIPPEGLIRCRECSGGQNTRMKCTMCLKKKGLEGFSLAQRSKKDDAICLLCQEDLDETHPDNRQLSTGHDSTLAFSKLDVDDDDDTSTAASEERAEIWIWDPVTGEYVTDDSSVANSHGGVRLPRSSASAISIRPFTGRRATPATPSSASGSTALTRGNLAKLSISGKGKGKAIAGEESDSESESSDSSADDTSVGAGVPLHGEAGNTGAAKLPSQSTSKTTKDKGKGKAKANASSSGSEKGGAKFRAYDPSGHLHVGRRAPSTAASITSASDAPTSGAVDGGWHGRRYKTDSPRQGDEVAANSRRKFARVKPQNPITRKYVGDEVPRAELLENATPGRTGINTNVMEDVSSDEND